MRFRLFPIRRLRKMMRNSRFLRSEQVKKVTIPPPPPINGYGRDFFGVESMERARDFMWEKLSDQQRADYVNSGNKIIRVIGNDTGDEYMIGAAIVRRVRDSTDFCLHVDPHGYIPYEDQILARKLLIEADEDLFLRTANWRSGRPLRR